MHRVRDGTQYGPCGGNPLQDRHGWAAKEDGYNGKRPEGDRAPCSHHRLGGSSSTRDTECGPTVTGAMDIGSRWAAFGK